MLETAKRTKESPTVILCHKEVAYYLKIDSGTLELLSREHNSHFFEELGDRYDQEVPGYFYGFTTVAAQPHLIAFEPSPKVKGEAGQNSWYRKPALSISFTGQSPANLQGPTEFYHNVELPQSNKPILKRLFRIGTDPNNDPDNAFDIEMLLPPPDPDSEGLVYEFLNYILLTNLSDDAKEVLIRPIILQYLSEHNSPMANLAAWDSLIKRLGSDKQIPSTVISDTFARRRSELVEKWEKESANIIQNAILPVALGLYFLEKEVIL